GDRHVHESPPAEQGVRGGACAVGIHTHGEPGGHRGGGDPEDVAGGAGVLQGVGVDQGGEPGGDSPRRLPVTGRGRQVGESVVVGGVDRSGGAGGAEENGAGPAQQSVLHDAVPVDVSGSIPLGEVGVLVADVGDGVSGLIRHVAADEVFGEDIGDV